MATFGILALLTGLCTWYRPGGRLTREAIVAAHEKLVLSGVAAGPAPGAQANASRRGASRRVSSWQRDEEPMTERQPLDDIDLKILSELQKDGRVRNNELASRVGISEPPCLRRVRSLRSRGIIKAIRATLDERLLGYEVISFVSIQLVSQAPATMQAFETVDCGDTAHPAVLADFGRRRLFAQMRRARCRGDAPAATAVHRHAGGPHHQKLSRAGRRQGCAAADTGRSSAVALPVE